MATDQSNAPMEGADLGPDEAEPAPLEIAHLTVVPENADRLS